MYENRSFKATKIMKIMINCICTWITHLHVCNEISFYIAIYIYIYLYIDISQGKKDIAISFFLIPCGPRRQVKKNSHFMAGTNMSLNILFSCFPITDKHTQKWTTVTHYFLKTLDRSQRCIHHQLRQTVHKSLGFHPKKRWDSSF